MSDRILNPVKAFALPFRRKRITYLQTHGVDSTELADLKTSYTGNVGATYQHDTPASPSMQSIVSEEIESRWSRRYKSTFSGWRFGALHFATWAAVVFLMNFVATIWGGVYQRSAGSLAEGDCGHIKNLNRGLHVLINILSTILLSGSNYCMQCLSAPTRTDVNQAHASGTWLDVGIPSIRNLKHISRRRLCLWLLLGLSSVPLHLLWVSRASLSKPLITI